MTNNLTCILTTTINIPYFLENILSNLKKFKHTDVFVVVVTDKKTPIFAKKYCAKVSKKYNIRVDYFDIAKQKKFFKKYPKIFSLIPFNDAMRRLLGSIYLLKQDVVPERLIFIDDDNFVSGNVDFLKGHLIVGKKIKTKTVSNKINFPNLYELTLIILAAILGATAFIFISHGYSIAKGHFARTGVMGFIQLPASIVLGFFIFNESLNFNAYFGSLLIIIAGANAIYGLKNAN